MLSSRANVDVADEVASLHQRVAQLTCELEGLRCAMQTRAVIEQAKGIIIATVGCDPDQAFDMLVRMSQQSHMKLHALASVMVATAGQQAQPTVPFQR